MNTYGNRGEGAGQPSDVSRLISFIFRALTGDWLLRELLDAGHFVAHEPHKHGFIRWRSVDPLFDFVARSIALTDFVARFANRRYYHFAVHTQFRSVILNGILDIRRQSIGPHHGR